MRVRLRSTSKSMVFSSSSSNTMLGHGMLSELGGLYQPIHAVMLVEYHLNCCCCVQYIFAASITHLFSRHHLLLLVNRHVWWWSGMCRRRVMVVQNNVVPANPQHIHRFLIILPKPRRIRVYKCGAEVESKQIV